jgi:hypothetical protein
MRQRDRLIATVLSVATLGISPAASGQRLSIGVVGGGSLTDSFPSETVPAFPGSGLGIRYFSASKDYVVGPMVELRLFSDWSIEVDGLYRKLHFIWAGVEADGSLNSISPSPVITWEFPVLAKYRFHWWKMQPFAELGPSFRTAGNLNGTHPSHEGITAGFGVELHARKLSFAPALRYTRWAADGISAGGANSGPNQIELLIGVSGGAESAWSPLGTHFSAGVAAGTGLTDALHISTFSGTAITNTGQGQLTQVTYPVKSFMIGPTVELALPKRFSVEVDAIYRPLRTETVTTFNGMKSDPFPGSNATWEIPVMAKYRFAMGLIRPFVEAGPSFRLPANNLSNYGFTAGAGIEMHLRMLKIAPSLRYTRWAPDNPNGTIPNQALILVGFAF